MFAFPVQEWTPPFQTEATCHVTPSARSLFHEQKGTNASETCQADRRYRAVYELFNYFYRNLFLPRNFNSVTNNSNNSYDISDYKCQNLTDKGGRLPGLAPGATIIRLPTDKEKTSPV